MTERLNFYAFISVLFGIVVLFGIGAFLSFYGRPMEALGLGGAGTGLIGVLGTFKPRTPGSSVGPNENVNVSQEQT